MRHLTSFLTAGLLASMLVVGSSGTAVAGHESGDGDTLAVLTAAVAEANQHVADIGADIQHQQESVNRALVEVASCCPSLNVTMLTSSSVMMMDG